MTQGDDTSMEKISFSSNDFSDNLSNPFGIEDSQLLSSEELNNFLLTDPDTITNAKGGSKQEEEDKDKDEDKDKEEDKDKSKSQSQSSSDQKIKDKKEEDVNSKQLLENILFDENTGNQEDESGTSDKEDNKNSGEEDSDKEEQPFTTLGKDLFRLGVFSKTSEDETEESINIKTGEELLERFTTEKKKGAIDILDNFLSQFGEDYRKMFDAVFVNGIAPQEYLDKFSKAESLGSLDIEDESNQVHVLKTYYKSLNWDDEKINKRLTKLRDYGDLEEEARTYQEVLLNKEKENLEALEKKKKEDIKKKQEKDLAIQNSYQRILSEKIKTQEIDGVPLTQKDAQEVYSYLVNKPYKLPDGELISEFDKDLMELNRPENHELKIKLGLLLKKKLDLSSVKKTTITKKSDALFTLTAKNAKAKEKQKEVRSFF